MWRQTTNFQQSGWRWTVDWHNPVFGQRENVQRDICRVTWILALQFLGLGPLGDLYFLFGELCKIPLYLWGNFSLFGAIWHFEPLFIIWGNSPSYESWREAETLPTVLVEEAECSLSQPSL